MTNQQALYLFYGCSCLQSDLSAKSCIMVCASELPAFMLSKTSMAAQCHQHMSKCNSNMSSGGGDKAVGAEQGRAQGGRGSQGQLGRVNGGVQRKVVGTSLSLGPCSHCSAQGDFWAVFLQSIWVCMCVRCAWRTKRSAHCSLGTWYVLILYLTADFCATASCSAACDWTGWTLLCWGKLLCAQAI